MFSNTSGGVWIGGVEFGSNSSVLASTTPCGTRENSVTAIDHADNLWAAYGSTLFECDSTGAAITSGSGYPNNVNDAEGVAIDGVGVPWFVTENGQIGAISSTGAAISPAGGYQNSSLFDNNGANYFALDGSGNAWVASDGNVVVEFIGVASPVVTPLATATATNTLGVRP